MPLHFLQDLPRELRDEIYLFALSSSTGYIAAYQPRENSNAMLSQVVLKEADPTRDPWKKKKLDCSNLYACKQMQKEVENVMRVSFWRHNHLLVTDHPEYATEARTLPVQHVVFRFNSFTFSNSRYLSNILQDLMPWSTDCSQLRSVTYMPVSQQLDLWAYLHEYFDHPNFASAFGGLGEKLRHSGVFLGKPFLRHIRVEVRFLWHELSAAQQRAQVLRRLIPQEFADEALQARQVLVEALASMHELFSADMIVNGVLCYKDGVQVADPLPLKPLPPEGTRDADGYLYHWAQYWGRKEPETQN